MNREVEVDMDMNLWMYSCCRRGIDNLVIFESDKSGSVDNVWIADGPEYGCCGSFLSRT